MVWLALLCHWLHVFLAIFWFGGTLTMFAIVGPALNASDPKAAFEVGGKIGARMTRILAPVGGLTILFGLINAIAFGPVKSLSFLWTSAYGITAVIALILAIVIASMGARTGRVAMTIATASESERPAILARINSLSVASVAGFVFVLICMVLMRYGL